MEHGLIIPSISLGEILQALVVLCGGLSVFLSMRFEIRAAGKRLEKVELDLGQISGAMITLARQDEQIKGVRAAIDRQEGVEQALLQRIALLESRRN